MTPIGNLKHVASALAMLAAAPAVATGASVSDPMFPPALRTLFERPAARLRSLVPPLDLGGPDGVVRCFRYATFQVKEVDYGEHGDDYIAVLPIRAGAPLPACALHARVDEIRLPDSAENYFLGTKGRFLFLTPTDGQDATSFTIRDAASGKTVFADQMATNTIPARLTLAADGLRLDYVRAVIQHCSILTGGAACWQAFARTAHLPRHAAPLALCRSGYRARGGSAGDASVLSYRVSLLIAPTGRQSVRGGALVACEPQS